MRITARFNNGATAARASLALTGPLVAYLVMSPKRESKD